jgi:hypothetical protein
MDAPVRRSRRFPLPLALIAIAAGVIGVWMVGAVLGARSEEAPAPATPVQPGKPGLSPVTILRPGIPRVATGRLLPNGEAETLSCGTCHAARTPDTLKASDTELDEFHQGLKFNHGSRTCLSCHNADDYDSLRLADGRTVAFPDVMDLCAQCHGTQYRDYVHGAHGGMTGHWDLTKGPRTRNNCITCHDPHAPAYPTVHPVFKPTDTQSRSSHHK